MRIHSVVPFVTSRVSTCDVTVLGHNFSSGVPFVCALGIVHKSSEFYPNPETFDPDRWDSSSAPYFPFGDGPHNCPGQKMAMIEMKVVLAHLISAYKLKWKEQDLKFDFSITYGLKHGLMIDFEIR